MNSVATARYAGFWRRLGATVIDNLILIPLLGVIGAWVFGSASAPALDDFSPAGIQAMEQQLLQQLLPLALTLALTVFFWVRFVGTPGKLLLHCHVVDAKTLAPLGVGQSVVRYIGYLISLLPFGLGFLWIALDPRKQAWHDKLAGSVVIVVSRPQAVQT